MTDIIGGGCDPGYGGAIGIYGTGRLIDVVDMPTITVVISKKKRQRLDEDKLHDLFTSLKDLYDMKVLVIEQVMGLPRQSAPAAFNFGHAYGVIRTAARYCGLYVHDASPGVWKLQMKVPTDERAICNRASLAYPEHKDLFWGAKGGPLHDRAEAAFLSEYAVKKIWPAVQPRGKLREAMKGLTA